MHQHSEQRGPECRVESSCRRILDLTFYGYFNPYIAGITSFNFHQDNGCIGFIILLKHIKRFLIQVSIPFIAKDIAIIRMLVTGGGQKQIKIWLIVINN